MKSSRGVELYQGESVVLAASAARTVGANGTAVFIGGERKRFIFVCAVTASAAAAGDTLNVFVDASIDGVTWLNAVHYTEQAGNGAARTEFAVLDPSNPGAVVINATADVAAGAVRPSLFGAYWRARWAIVDAGGGAQEHTFSVIGYGL